MIFVYILAFIIIAGTISTFYVQQDGPEAIRVFGPYDADRNVLVVYDPDPIFNLDEQICYSIAQSLSECGWRATVATFITAEKMEYFDYDLYIYCANTYMYAPDRSIRRYIKNQGDLMGVDAIALTVGSGSTKRAQRLHEESIIQSGATLLDSKCYWIHRPNDENRLNESNVEVAVEMAYNFGKEINEMTNFFPGLSEIEAQMN